MADLPIAFSAPMVLALLAGRKTQTRRVYAPGHHTLMMPLKFKYVAGDRLYVREHITLHRASGMPYVRYTADGKPTFLPWPAHWRKDWAPPMHMPKEFSRLTLLVSAARVERLQDISEEDAKAEGCEPKIHGADHGKEFTRGYIKLWNSLNEIRGYGWKENPWVTVTTFSIRYHNIDRPLA